MPFVCLSPSARRSVPVWMCPALEDATGDSWHAVWALTGVIFLFLGTWGGGGGFFIFEVLKSLLQRKIITQLRWRCCGYSCICNVRTLCSVLLFF